MATSATGILVGFIILLVVLFLLVVAVFVRWLQLSRKQEEDASSSLPLVPPSAPFIEGEIEPFILHSSEWPPPLPQLTHSSNKNLVRPPPGPCDVEGETEPFILHSSEWPPPLPQLRHSSDFNDIRPQGLTSTTPHFNMPSGEPMRPLDNERTTASVTGPGSSSSVPSPPPTSERFPSLLPPSQNMTTTYRPDRGHRRTDSSALERDLIRQVEEMQQKVTQLQVRQNASSEPVQPRVGDTTLRDQIAFQQAEVERLQRRLRQYELAEEPPEYKERLQTQRRPLPVPPCVGGN